MKFKSDKQRRFIMNMFASVPDGAFRNQWGSADVVVKNMPVKQLYHLRGMYGLQGPRHTYRSTDEEFRKYMKDLYNDDFITDDKDMFKSFIGKKESDIRAEGFVPLPPKIRLDEERGYGYKAFIPYRWEPERLAYKKENIMQPFNTCDLCGKYKVAPKEHSIEAVNEASAGYLDNMAKEIAEGTGTVPIIGVSSYDAKRRTLGEGRHRILAAQKLGYDEIPVVIELKDGEPVMSKSSISQL